MKSYLEEQLSELLPHFGLSLSLEQQTEFAEALETSIDCYQSMMSGSVAYWNPAEDKVKELSKQMEPMHSDQTVKHLKDDLDDHKREIKRLRLVIEELQGKLKN